MVSHIDRANFNTESLRKRAKRFSHVVTSPNLANGVFGKFRYPVLFSSGNRLWASLRSVPVPSVSATLGYLIRLIVLVSSKEMMSRVAAKPKVAVVADHFVARVDSRGQEVGDPVRAVSLAAEIEKPVLAGSRRDIRPALLGRSPLYTCPKLGGLLLGEWRYWVKLRPSHLISSVDRVVWPLGVRSTLRPSPFYN